MSGIDRTAIMISNNSPVPNVTSASTGNTTAWNAFDKADSQWVGTGTSGTLKYDFGSALWASDEYTIEPQSPTRAPRDWTFQGSNNDADWTTLDTQSSITTWSVGVVKSFSFVNSTKYRYYQIVITANNGDGSNTEIDEMTINAPSTTQGGFILHFV